MGTIGCDMSKFDGLDQSEKTIAYLVIGDGQMRPKRREIRYAGGLYVKYGKT